MAHLAPDVVIRYGEVPAQLSRPVTSEPAIEIQGKDWLLRMEAVAGARYLVSRGCEITIERMPGSHDDTVRLFLLMSAMVLVLAQRGVFSLHGNALTTARGAVVIAGESGAGKSSLTAALQQRGYGVLTDDICAISIDSVGAPIVHPGFPRLKLWPDMLDRLGEDKTLLRRIGPNQEKYQLPLGNRFCPQAQPVRAVYVLQATDEDEVSLRPVTGMAKMACLEGQIFRPDQIEVLRLQPMLFRRVAALSQHATVQMISRPRSRDTLDELVDLLASELSRDSPAKSQR